MSRTVQALPMWAMGRKYLLSDCIKTVPRDFAFDPKKPVARFMYCPDFGIPATRHWPLGKSLLGLVTYRVEAFV